MQNNPYIGPRPYERNDQHKFYGRNREARDLLALTLAHRVVLLYAQSGAGKTSLLNAQIIPTLEEKEGFQVLPVARVGSAPPPDIDPANISNIFVFSALMGLAGADTPAETLIHHTLRSFLEEQRYTEETEDQWTAVEGQSSFLVIFDQFEELFTTHRERWQDAKGFFEQVTAALDALPNLGVMFAMREDHVAALDPYAALLPNRLRARFRMERLGPEGALEAIVKPAQSAGIAFAPGVAERLVDDLRQIKTETRLAGEAEFLGPYIEPVQLQVVCQRLWDSLPEQQDHVIQWEEIEQYGDIDQALTDFYASVLFQTTQMTGAAERTLRHWFGEQLITPMKTRGLALRGPAETAGMPNPAVDFLESHHLIRADVRAGARWYELVHDRLIDPILRSNQAWELARQTPLRLAAQRWKNGDKHPGLLYRDKTLQQALAWVKEHPTDIEPEEREFLEACQKAEETRLRMQRVRIAGSAIGLVVLVVIIALAWLAMRSSTLAYSRQMAATSITLMGTQTRESIQLAREGILMQRRHPFWKIIRPLLGQLDTTEAEIALRQAAADFYPATMFGDLGDQVLAVTYQEQLLCAGLASGGVRVWDMESGSERAPLPGPGPQGRGPVWSMDTAHDPDGKLLYLAIAGDDGVTGGAVRIWDIERDEWTLQLQIPLPQKIYDEIYATAFSPERAGTRYLATGGDYGPNWRTSTLGSDKGLVRIWTLADAPTGGLTAQVALTLTQPTVRVRSVDFSRDGRYLAAASDDGVIYVWTLDQAEGVTTTRLITLTDHVGAVKAVAFSPTEDLLASASSDKTIRVRSAKNWRAILSLVEHSAEVTSLAFSADGRYLISGARDDTVRIWNVGARNPNALIVLTGPAGVVNSVGISPDQRFIVAGAGDRAVHIWDSDVPRRLRLSTFSGHTGRARGVAFSPDGQLIASSDDSGARVWSAGNGDLIFSLPVKSKIWNLAFSPDGQYLVTVSEDGKTRLWDVSSHTLAKELGNHTNDVNIAAFSTDGKWMVTGSDDGRAIVWDTQSWNPRATLPATDRLSEVFAAAFRPDGKLVATGHTDDKVRLWKMSPQPDGALNAELAATLTGHTNDIYGLAFSPDGRYLASASWDETVRFWSTETYTATGQPLKHPGWVYSVAWSPDGKYLASGSRDWRTRLWDVTNLPKAPRLVGELPWHTDLVWSVTFSPDGKYLASASWDGTVRRYAVRLKDVLEASWQFAP